MKEKFWVQFYPGISHTINGILYDHECLMEIECEYTEVKDNIDKIFGGSMQWSCFGRMAKTNSIWVDPNRDKIFPRGILQIPDYYIKLQEEQKEQERKLMSGKRKLKL